MRNRFIYYTERSERTILHNQEWVRFQGTHKIETYNRMKEILLTINKTMRFRGLRPMH
ncbi:hypothetical protein AR505_0649 [methanogenic archaeon ISO4-H5]|jgi:uncharacterized membrane protein YcgQ (UPF0703/DUF1980 family)|nr:hypothetical protein AR505_0649 [methanogenic archaeon ISO4-H5]